MSGASRNKREEKALFFSWIHEEQVRKSLTQPLFASHSVAPYSVHLAGANARDGPNVCSRERERRIAIGEEEQIRLDAQVPAQRTHREVVQRRWISAGYEN